MTDVRPLLDLLGDTRARIVSELQRQPMTAAQMAEVMGMSAAGVRRHLAALASDDLVASRTVHDGSMGRPHEEWSLANRGRRLFADRSAEFADELLVHLKDTYGRGAVTAFLKARVDRHADRWADELADIEDPAERAQRLAAALSGDGFAAQVVPDADGRSLTLLQSHCAIEGIAAEHPEVCAHEAALFKRLLGMKVSRRETIASGANACVCRIDLPSSTSPSAPRSPISDRSS